MRWWALDDFRSVRTKDLDTKILKFACHTSVSHQKRSVSVSPTAEKEMRCCSTQTVIIVSCLACLVASQAEFDEFNINDDFKIDAPAVTPMTTGMEDMLSLGLGGSSVAGGPVGPSLAPQPQNGVTHDLSGWGPMGKMHPSLILKDRMVHAYHNRPPDPRYQHLSGYGHQGLKPLPPLKRTAAGGGLDEKLSFFAK